MKKILDLILILVMVVSVVLMGTFSFTVNATTITSGKTGDCTWTLNGTELTISGNGRMANYSESSMAPWGTEITKVTIKNGVVNVGDYAFYNCDSLGRVTIPDSVTVIGEVAFAGCNALETTIPDSVTVIGGCAFFECLSLNTIIPDSVTVIGYGAFIRCWGFHNIAIPGSVKVIGNYAFEGCEYLTSITISDGVTSIGDGAFSDCSSLTSITISDSITSIGYNVFDGTAYYNNDSNWSNDVLYIGNHLVAAKKEISGDYSIKDGTLTIAGGAFYGCSSLTSITIPDSVTGIGNSVVRHTAYYNDTTNWQDNVLYIGNHLIEATNDISGEYTVKSGTLTVADSAFAVCQSLTSVTIPDSVTSIGNGAFHSHNLTEIVVDENNNSYCSVDGVLFNKDKTVLIKYPADKTSTSYLIPNSVTRIGDMAFYCCYNLTSLNVGNSVTGIGDYAFNHCSNLNTIYYRGSEIEKENIIGDWAKLNDATWYYNCCIDGITHSYTNDCDRECNICGAFRRAPHHYDNACDDECDSCGAQREVDDHTYKKYVTLPTCTNQGYTIYTCTECGYSYEGDYTNLSAHTYSNTCDTNCNICGFTRDITHTFTSDCDGECNICFYTRKPPHKYKNACDNECDACGKTRTVPDHIYDNDFDATCNECGSQREAKKYGDANGDNKINGRDYAMIMQYLNDWDVAIDLQASDVNGDGKINGRDYALIMQYLNDWDVELG